jgi:hypothetical protein
VWDGLLPALRLEGEDNQGSAEEGLLNIDEPNGRLAPESGVPDDPAHRRRYLFLLLRNAYHVGEREIRLFARATGYDSDWLTERITNLKETLMPRIERLRALRCRRTRAYSQLLVAENELRLEVDDGEQRRLRKRIGRLRKIMRQAAEDIARIPLHPTHRAIAEELGIPKGTVDTGMRWIKQRIPRPSPQRPLYTGRTMGYASTHGNTSGYRQQSQERGVREDLFRAPDPSTTGAGP